MKCALQRYFSSIQGRHHVLNRGVDRGAERALRRLPLDPALLVLPILPGQVQEVRGTGGPRREGVINRGRGLHIPERKQSQIFFYRFEVDDPDAPQEPPY